MGFGKSGILWVELVQLLFLAVISHCATIRKEECGDADFTCPDDCRISWTGGCPESCDCSPAVQCPDIPCPAEPPICIIYTKHNGCQSCACQAPFKVVEPSDVGFIKKTTTKKPTPPSPTPTITNTSTTTSTAIITTTTTSTTPSTTTTTRFENFPVEPSFTKVPSIEAVTPASTIPATIEDFLVEPGFTLVPAPAAVTQVSTTTTVRPEDFSVQPAFPLVQSIPAATPVPDATRGNSQLQEFQVAPKPGLTLIQVKEETNICDFPLQKEVDKYFGELYAEIKQKSQSATKMYPAIFGFTKDELTDRCKGYKTSTSLLSFSAKRNCYTNYEVYDTVYNAYSYACGYGTELYFMRYFDCLSNLKIDPKVAHCDSPNAVDGSQHDFEDFCTVYNSLLSCIYEPVVRSCGYDGWEIEYQYLSTVVRKFNRNCDLRRINLTLNLRNNVNV